MATEQEEVAGLDRVLTRLAVTDDDKLEKVWAIGGPAQCTRSALPSRMIPQDMAI
jgi:hypothetical protein